MPSLADHQIQFWVFVAFFGLAALLGIYAARWRRPQNFNDLDQWGLGGRSFGSVVLWFLLGGEIYTAYTFVALPVVTFGAGAIGFYAVPLAVTVFPLGYLGLTRLWSVAHVHGLVTPADFVRARFGSRLLALLVALTGIAATMPYIALQIAGMRAVLETLGLPGDWPLWLAFGVLAIFTYRSGLRGPALISFVKDILLLYVIFAVLQTIAMSWGGWEVVFRDAGVKFGTSKRLDDGLTLPGAGIGSQWYYISLALGSALGLWLYPHAITGFLAAKNRTTVKRAFTALPIYTFMLGVLALLGFAAISYKITPVVKNGVPDTNTIIPRLLDSVLPSWTAGLGFAAIGIGALVPAAVMSIAAANLFSRNIYREYLRPNASPKEEATASKLMSLFVKFGALSFILFLNPQYSLDLQLIGTVIIVQTLPAVGFGMFTSWFHRYALVAGLLGGLASGLLMLWYVPNPTTKHLHFGGSNFDLNHLGFSGHQMVFVGILALGLNIAIVVLATPVLRILGVREGVDLTSDHDYVADEGEATVRRLTELVDGGPVESSLHPGAAPLHPAMHGPPRHATPPPMFPQASQDLQGGLGMRPPNNQLPAGRDTYHHRR